MTEIDFIYAGKELEIFSRAKNWKKYLSGFITPHIKGNVLEAGPGLGAMTFRLNTGNHEKWILLEPDIKMAALLKEKIADIAPDKNYSVVNGTIKDINTLLFDTIIYIDVLEHIDNDGEEMRKAFSLLHPGGKLIILSPAFQFLFSPFDKEIGHFRRYSKKSLTEVVGKNFKKDSIRYLDTAGFFSSLLNKILLKQNYPSEKQIIFWDRLLVPASSLLDRILFYSFGKSILGIWRK